MNIKREKRTLIIGPPHGALLESAWMYSIPDKSLSSITKSTNLKNGKKKLRLNSSGSL